MNDEKIERIEPLSLIEKLVHLQQAAEFAERHPWAVSRLLVRLFLKEIPAEFEALFAKIDADAEKADAPG